jgi:penicillin-binding protein 1C
MLRRYKIAVFFFLISVLGLSWFFLPDPGLYPAVSWSKAYSDENGKLLRLTLSDDDKYRLFVPLKDISPYLKKAVVLYEDRHFYDHFGFNPFSLFRAGIDTYVLKKRVVGGSTITMQVARISFHIDSRSVSGKLKQILRAVQLERHYTKKEILEAYLNLAPYGGNIEGSGSASRIYFKKSVSELNLSEALALAVIPQNPTSRFPEKRGGQKELEKARQRLINIWNDEKDKKISEINRLSLNYYSRKNIAFKAPHFTDWLEKRDDVPLKGEIKTSLDLNLQNILEDKISSYVKRKKILGILNSSALILNYKTMEIKAMAGSADYFDDSIEGQVNGCDAKRSPGSTLKPFVYALAADQGFIHSHTLLKDAPASFSGFTPENYDKKFEGPLFAKDALIKSRNLPAVDLASKIKKPDLYMFLKNAGVKGLQKKSFYGLSLVLGGGEVTMIELARLYSIIGNKGYLKNLRYLKNKNNETGETRLLSNEASFMINSMLAENPSTDEIILKRKKRIPVSWKTGTSYGFRDGWAAGIFGDYVLCVWVGNFSGEGNPSFIGRKGAGPLFFDIADMVKSYDKNIKSHLDESLVFNIKKVDVCAVSGDLPGKYTPHTTRAWFIPGVSPIFVSKLHRPVYIDKKTGKRSCEKDPLKTEQKIFEFWPTDMKRLFEKGGIYIKSPPEYMDECIGKTFTDSGISPHILSPVEGVKYLVFKDKRKIPFKASAETGVKNLYWFVNSNYEGKSKPGDVFLWKPVPGKHLIRVVDDLGRADIIKIEAIFEGA